MMFFGAQMNWIGLQGSYGMAVSFLILTRVNTDDGDHWLFSVSGTIGCELSETRSYLGHFLFFFCLLQTFRNARRFWEGEMQWIAAEDERMCVQINSFSSQAKRGVFKHNTAWAQHCQNPFYTTSIELHYLLLLPLSNHAVVQAHFCPQLSNVWSVKLRYGPLTTSHWWPHSSSITLWQSVRPRGCAQEKSCRNESWCSSPGKLHKMCSKFLFICEKSKESNILRWSCCCFWFKDYIKKCTWKDECVCALLWSV